MSRILEKLCSNIMFLFFSSLLLCVSSQPKVFESLLSRSWNKVNGGHLKTIKNCLKTYSKFWKNHGLCNGSKAGTLIFEIY